LGGVEALGGALAWFLGIPFYSKAIFHESINRLLPPAISLIAQLHVPFISYFLFYLDISFCLLI